MRTLYLMMGVPGSGKSTYVRNQIKQKGGIHVSRDAIRFTLVKENEDYFSKENLVIQTFIQNIQEAIDNTKEDIYADATHLTTKSRNAILRKLNLDKIDEVHVVLVDPGVYTAIYRNNQRTGREKVPQEVIKSMYKSMNYPSGRETLIDNFSIVE